MREIRTPGSVRGAAERPSLPGLVVVAPQAVVLVAAECTAVAMRHGREAPGGGLPGASLDQGPPPVDRDDVSVSDDDQDHAGDQDHDHDHDRDA